VDFVEADCVVEERDDERDPTDQTMPETKPEPGDVAVGRGGVGCRIGTGSTTAHLE